MAIGSLLFTDDNAERFQLLAVEPRTFVVTARVNGQEARSAVRLTIEY